MGRERISEKDIAAKCETINRMLAARGSTLELCHLSRNGYQAVDFKKDGTYSDFLAGGTNRECYNELQAVINVLGELP